PRPCRRRQVCLGQRRDQPFTGVRQLCLDSPAEGGLGQLPTLRLLLGMDRNGAAIGALHAIETWRDRVRRASTPHASLRPRRNTRRDLSDGVLCLTMGGFYDLESISVHESM